MFNAISSVFPQDMWVSSTAANVNGALQNLNYNPLFRSGYTDNGNTLGQLLDKNKNIIYAVNDTSSSPSSYSTGFVNVSCTAGASGSPTCPTGVTWFYENAATNAIAPAGATFASCGTSYLPGCATATATTIPEVSNYPDYMSLLSVGGNLYTIAQFEAPQPAAMYMTQARGACVLAPTAGQLTLCALSGGAERQRRAGAQAGHAGAG